MGKRFKRSIEALEALRRQHPHDGALASEINIAIGILHGKPGIEEKYDALLAKLFRMRSRWMDMCAHAEANLPQMEFLVPRAKVQARLKLLRRIIADTYWVEARNADLIRLANKQHAQHPEQTSEDNPPA